MRRKFLLILFVACFVLSIFTIGLAQEEKKEEKAAAPAHEYVGADKCKICHKKDGTFPSWEETPHAGAWMNVDTLKLAEDKQAVCKGCHTTGVTAKGEMLAGVQCEACHGPGADYKKKSIMEDLEAAKANGLLIPDEKTCLGCHDKTKAPKPYHDKMPEKFEFEKMKAKGIHTIAAKEETAE